jgi:hypothetical protein
MDTNSVLCGGLARAPRFWISKAVGIGPNRTERDKIGRSSRFNHVIQTFRFRSEVETGQDLSVWRARLWRNVCRKPSCCTRH